MKINIHNYKESLIDLVIQYMFYFSSESFPNYFYTSKKHAVSTIFFPDNQKIEKFLAVFNPSLGEAKLKPWKFDLCTQNSVPLGPRRRPKIY